MSDLTLDRKFRIKKYSNSSSVRFTNKRVTVMDCEDTIGNIVHFEFRDDNAGKPACFHASKRGKIRLTSIKLSDEAIEALLIAYVERRQYRIMKGLDSLKNQKSMTKIEQLESEYLAARKSGNEVTKNLLSTFKGEYELKLKNSPTGFNSESDKLVILETLARTFNKNLMDLREKEVAASRGTSVIEEELKIIEKYLPILMSVSEVETFISGLDLSHLTNIRNKMGFIMKELKGKAYGNDVKYVVNKLFS